MAVVKTAVRKGLYFGGARFFELRVDIHDEAAGFSCYTDRIPSALEIDMDSNRGRDDLEEFGQDYCCKGHYRSTKEETIELTLDGKRFRSFVVCKKWLEKNIPDIFAELYPPVVVEPPLKISLREAPTYSFPENGYGLIHGENADESLRLLTRQIGAQFVRELALTRRVSIDEIVRTAEEASRRVANPPETIPNVTGRGDCIPWWIRKGYSECPLSHEY